MLKAWFFSIKGYNSGMKFREFSTYLEKLEKTSSRNKIMEILAELFKKSNIKEIDKVVYLSLGSLAPSYKSIVFNVAERMMLQVIAKAYSKDPEKIRLLYKKKGDLGDVAYEVARGKGKGLTVSDVYGKLLEIAKDEGEGSQERKEEGKAEGQNRLRKGSRDDVPDELPDPPGLKHPGRQQGQHHDLHQRDHHLDPAGNRGGHPGPGWGTAQLSPAHCGSAGFLPSVPGLGRVGGPAQGHTPRNDPRGGL